MGWSKYTKYTPPPEGDGDLLFACHMKRNSVTVQVRALNHPCFFSHGRHQRELLFHQIRCRKMLRPQSFKHHQGQVLLQQDAW